MKPFIRRFTQVGRLEAFLEGNPLERSQLKDLSRCLPNATSGAVQLGTLLEQFETATSAQRETFWESLRTACAKDEKLVAEVIAIGHWTGRRWLVALLVAVFSVCVVVCAWPPSMSCASERQVLVIGSMMFPMGCHVWAMVIGAIALLIVLAPLASLLLRITISPRSIAQYAIGLLGLGPPLVLAFHQWVEAKVPLCFAKDAPGAVNITEGMYTVEEHLNGSCRPGALGPGGTRGTAGGSSEGGKPGIAAKADADGASGAWGASGVGGKAEAGDLKGCEIPYEAGKLRNWTVKQSDYCDRTIVVGDEQFITFHPTVTVPVGTRMQKIRISNHEGFALSPEDSGGVDSSTVSGLAGERLSITDKHQYKYTWCPTKPSDPRTLERVHIRLKSGTKIDCGALPDVAEAGLTGAAGSHAAGHSGCAGGGGAGGGGAGGAGGERAVIQAADSGGGTSGGVHAFHAASYKVDLKKCVEAQLKDWQVELEPRSNCGPGATQKLVMKNAPRAIPLRCSTDGTTWSEEQCYKALGSGQPLYVRLEDFNGAMADISQCKECTKPLKGLSTASTLEKHTLTASTLCCVVKANISPHCPCTHQQKFSIANRIVAERGYAQQTVLNIVSTWTKQQVARELKGLDCEWQ